jgi:hypothetical protein
VNDQPNFTSILDKPAESLEAPKPIPVGSYLAMISGPEAYSKVGANQTDLVKWPVKLIQPQADVDVAQLNEALSLKDGTTKSLGDVKLTYDAFLTEASAFIVRDFLQNVLGIEAAGKSLRQMISEALGKQMIVTIKHGLTKGDNPRVFAQITDTAKV